MPHSRGKGDAEFPLAGADNTPQAIGNSLERGSGGAADRGREADQCGADEDHGGLVTKTGCRDAHGLDSGSRSR
jgi:hypothetical protein